MIFVTVGSMFPFDRLVQCMDEFSHGLEGETVFAQIGAGSYEPTHMEWARRLTQREFSEKIEGSSVVVAHAGMGSVITADQFKKPIVLLPRIQEWGEHTTDHQIATANWLRGKPGIFVADTNDDIAGAINEARLLTRQSGRETNWGSSADPEFLSRIRTYALDSLGIKA